MVKNEAGIAFGDIAHLTVRTTKEKPPNDDIENAAVLIGDSGTRSVFNRNATGQTGEPDHASASAPLNSVWWKWTAPRSGRIRLDTQGSTFDTTIAAYRQATQGGGRRAGTVSTQSTPELIPASQEADAIVRIPNHGFTSGDRIKLTQLNGYNATTATFTINVLSTDTFTLQGTAGAVNLSLSANSSVEKQ